MNMIPIETLSSTTLPRIISAAGLFPCPRRIEVRAADPAPTMAPKAAARFINGIVSARPDMAIGPTPWPMNMLSIML